MSYCDFLSMRGFVSRERILNIAAGCENITAEEYARLEELL